MTATGKANPALTPHDHKALAELLDDDALAAEIVNKDWSKSDRELAEEASAQNDKTAAKFFGHRPRSAVYGAGTIKRDRRTKARQAQLDRQIVAVLKEDHPQSLRHVFYRVTDPRLPEPVEKSDRGYRHVGNRVLALRRSGVLPYAWVSDATRRGFFVDTFNGAADFLSRVAGLYRADLWGTSAHYCEVWTESRSIAGMIETDCRELAVTLYPCGGFSSETLAFQAAECINNRGDNRPVTIFYIGDYDPAGVLIDRDIESKLRRHLSASVEMEFVRLGITPEQIAEFQLPTKPRKETERRAQHVRHTVEAEAMPARVMRAILRSAVETLLPADALAVAKVAEQSERAFFHKLAAVVGDSPQDEAL